MDSVNGKVLLLIIYTVVQFNLFCEVNSVIPKLCLLPRSPKIFLTGGQFLTH